MSALKNFLVDVPVCIYIWVRPECQRKQFEVIKEARPRILFLLSDGGRNEEEWEKIYINRKMFEEIDWQCEIHKLYEDENLGQYSFGKKGSQYIWKHVDRCVFLEDDQVPSVSFFQYCAELLERYKDDLRISCICGMNHLGVSENVNADYFFSRRGSGWGIAMWRRTYEMRDLSFEYANDQYVMKLLEQRIGKYKGILRAVKGYPKNMNYGGHVASFEFFTSFAMYGYNQLVIVPKKNLISCMGATGDAAHSDELAKLPRGLRRIFNMKTYEMTFPMKHTKYVIPDVEYEKKRNRIMGQDVPLIEFGRRVEVWFTRLCRGEFLIYLKKAINSRRRIEN